MTQIRSSAYQYGGASIAQAYDEIMVPNIFGPWAAQLGAFTEPPLGSRVLDVATGTGAVARELATLVGESGIVCGIDLSAQMLDVARSKPREDRAAEISYEEGDATALRFPDATFDVVACQQVIQFLEEPGKATSEMRRVLRPGGRLGLAVWQAYPAGCPFYMEARSVVAEVIDPDAAAMLNKPYSWPSREQLHNLLAASGFSDIEIVEQSHPLVFSGGIDEALDSLLATPLAPIVAERLDELKTVAHRRLASFVDAGSVKTSCAAWFARASK